MQRLIVSLIVLLALIASVGGYVHWQNTRYQGALEMTEHAWAMAETYHQEAQALATQLEAAQHAERVITQYVDRVRTVRERGQTIIQEVPVYVTETADAACPVPAGFVRLHDAAAQNLSTAPTSPDATGDPDAPAPSIALSDVAKTLVDNYTTCHATAAQLNALQDWVRGVVPAEAITP